MTRLRHRFALGASLVTLLSLACAPDTPLAPDPAAHSRRPLTPAASANRDVAQCTPREWARAGATIGPRGGMIEAGGTRLYVPPGALREEITITATVPAGEFSAVHFEPHGLEFRKAPLLALDAAGCDLEYAAEVVYIRNGQIEERIAAAYVPRYRTVVVPITHFSIYAIATRRAVE